FAGSSSMSSFAIRNVRIVQPGASGWPGLSDILVEHGVIAAISPAGQLGALDGESIDLAGALAIPGHVNAHAHNHEIYLKGTGWGLPLEPYILANSPHAPSGAGLSDDEIYDRTLASAREMIRNGIVSVADDVIHPRLDEGA